MKENIDQINLFKLVFAHNWEDPATDIEALNIKKNDTVLAITSGGCNVLEFLLYDPKEIQSVDINPAQSYLLELKVAAIKALDFEQFAAFAGMTNAHNRKVLFNSIKHLLSKEALHFWNDQQKILSGGFLMNGKYERFIRLAGKFILLLQGRKRVLGLFEDKSLIAQQEYFDKIWDTNRFKYMFKILFNKRVLAKRGLVADYFTFDDGSKSFAESFYNRSKKAFRDLPIKGNYFLSLYLLGRFINTEEVPAYLKKENFDLLKSRVYRIKIITGEAQKLINSLTGNYFDCFALSNICELMSEQETHNLFTSVARTAKDGARIIFRNLMIPREVPDDQQDTIKKNQDLSKSLYDKDRSFVYGKVAAYVVHKLYNNP